MPSSDFNGDGRDDILWRSTGGNLTDWLAQPNGGFVSNDAVGEWPVIMGAVGADSEDRIARTREQHILAIDLSQNHGAVRKRRGRNALPKIWFVGFVSHPFTDLSTPRVPPPSRASDGLVMRREPF